MSAAPLYDVVIPTVGRPSLQTLLAALARQADPRRGRVIVADDAELRTGPAAARNRGWRAGSAPWVVFLDDDVLPTEGWSSELHADLDRAADDVGGVQGRIRVPLPRDRRPTDWERNVAGLERARWATADLAYRRAALEAVGGFDERFRRAYREDADLGLRVVAAGWQIVRGAREIVHPVGPAGPWTSVRLQRGNADDVLMRRLHGPDWRSRAGAPPGRLPRHALVAAAGLAAVGLRASGSKVAAGLAAAAWLAGTAELAWARIAPGPRTAKELLTMATTSAAIPFAATSWRAVGEFRHAGARKSAAETSPGEEKAADFPKHRRWRSCSTATGRSWRTCRTTAIRRSSSCGRGRSTRSPRCATRGCGRRSSPTSPGSRAGC